MSTVFLYPFINAQNNVSFSLRAGLNMAQIFGQGSQAFNHFGFSGGTKLGWRFSKKISFDPELIYNMKGGARYPDIEKGDYYSFSVDLDYIEMPILFNYYFDKKEKFSIEFGPSFGILVRQKAYENGQAINSTNTGFNLYDVSIALGLHYYLQKGFALNFRFMNSIAPISPTYGVLPWGVSSINIGQLNSVLNFSVVYKFKFTKKENSKEKPTLINEKKIKQKGDVIDEDD